MPGRKKQQFRTPYRRPAARPNSQKQDGDRSLDGPARDLMLTHDISQLRTLIEQRTESCRFADEHAQTEPSPRALRAYQIAARSLAEAERALVLALELNRSSV